MLDSPRGLRLIKRRTRRPRDFRPRVALGGMQPAATEIQIQACQFVSPGAAAESGTRLEEQGGKAARRQPPGSADARRATADDHDVEIRAQGSLTPVSSASLAMRRS